MKVVVINGSYHSNGVISFLVDKFITALKNRKKDVEIKEYNLIDIPIEFCKACGCCVRNDGKKIGECPQADFVTVRKILQDMLDSDILVYATPIYEKAMTALLKRFMERSMAVLYMGKAGPVGRNETNKNKTGIILVSCGSPFPVYITQGVIKYPIDILTMFCKGFGCKKVEKIIVPGAASKEELNDKYLKRIYHLSVKLGNNNF
ncbi:MAG: flavodoxin family protein [Clostridia bacterium]|nr:flavodoxin family protein [Clostridia bacterium]